MFINTEFDHDSQMHNSLDLSCTDRSKFPRSKAIRIIDDNVFDRAKHNVALTKRKFAEYVTTGEPNFNDFDFLPFKGIFDNLKRIMDKTI
ncbi:hypothetical protein JP09_009570 [Dehalogenimonas etheniformans]|uniref:Uncharacterized protein n=1 Tax=Dehalogenimonas etheniformans TaxID=1536648 RepID=A0A2P5P4R9_9CHLR|nr:hypothetical protein JP09_009570 [Dehalogenimonas etheniformans]